MEHLSGTRELIIPSGTSVFEAVSMTLIRADTLRTKLSMNADSILAAIRSKCKGRIRGHHLTAIVRIIVNDDGSLIIR